MNNKELFDSLKAQGIITKYEDYQDYLTKTGQQELATQQEETERKNDYNNWKGRLTPEDLQNYNFIFNEN